MVYIIIYTVNIRIYTVRGEENMIIEMKDVGRKLGNFKLENISIKLPKGYIMGLIGPNGAGKTSLIHLLLGLYLPDEGEILIDGKNYAENEVAIREMTGAVLLEELFDDGLTLHENGNEYGKFYANYDANVLEKYIERFGLDSKRKYKALSKGEKLKFQFAFALSHDTKLLILDEPTGNFDPQFRKEFFEVLKEFIADGTRSVVLSTHLTEDLDRIADYILYLESGKTIFSGDIETLRESYRLVTGEEYKIKLINKENIIHMEPGNYGTKALVKHRRRYEYDTSLTVAIPSVEEFMYFMTKRGHKS